MALATIPDELILNVVALLDPEDIVPLQLVSQRFRDLARDKNIWKAICFQYSRFEADRRRREWLAAQEASLAQLREAVQGLAYPNASTATSNSQLLTVPQGQSDKERRNRALINWDPEYPGENVDFYREYVQRHGQITVDWFEECKTRQPSVAAEAMGIGTLLDGQTRLRHTVSPMDDGSLCIWEASADAESHKQGRLVAQSHSGLLSVLPDVFGSIKSITNETGAIENVSVDSQMQRGYFAVHDMISEVDLTTLQIVSRQRYAFPVSSISASEPFAPLTVGTTHTMHLLDPRVQNSACSSSQAQQIAGINTSLHSPLSEPGPLSIVHHPLASAPDEIWVAGRFKSLLCYDRRYWPRVSQTLFSGARISSIAALPFPFLSRDIDLTNNPTLSIADRSVAKSELSSTLMAAGEYRGKGSLELYNLAPSPFSLSNSLPAHSRFQNRQTASRTRLLSVAPHGGRVVFADGDGQLKWTERDGSTLVREFNINDFVPKRRDTVDYVRGGAEIRTVYHDRDSGIGTPSSIGSEESHVEGIFAEGENGDIVQRVIPTGSKYDDLLIWTADGRLGLVGFGRGRGPGFGGKHVTKGKGDGGDGPEDDETRAEREEQLFGMRMRRALERQADEARFVHNLGLGGRWR